MFTRPHKLYQQLHRITIVFFFSWLFGSRQNGGEDEKYSSKAVSFKIVVHDVGKFDGKPEHWYVFKNKIMPTLGVRLYFGYDKANQGSRRQPQSILVI